MQTTRTRSWLTVIGLVLAFPIAVLCALMAAYNVYAMVSGVGSAWLLPTAVLFTVGSAVAIAGLLVVGRRPMLGATLAVSGSAIVGGTWWLAGFGEAPMLWGLVLFLPLSIIGVIRAREEMSSGRPHVA
jgi:hypothetical protein